MKTHLLLHDHETERPEVQMKHPLLIAALTFVLVVSLTLSGHGADRESQPASPQDEHLKKISKEEARRIVVARVNGVDITMDSVIEMMNRTRPRKERGAITPENIDALKKKAVDRLVFQELAYQEGKTMGLQPGKEKIDLAVTDFITKLGEEEYRKFLEREGLSEEGLRMQIDRSLTIEGVYAREVAEKSTVTEDELRKAYEQQKDRFFKPEKVVVEDVVFFLRTDDPGSEKKAEEILMMIREDKERSPRNLVLDGTFIVRDYEVKKDRDPQIYDAAKKLKEGDLSGVIKTPDSLHIVKLKAYTPETQITFEEAKGYLEEMAGTQAQRKRMDEWKDELMRKAKIEIFDTPSGSIKTN